MSVVSLVLAELFDLDPGHSVLSIIIGRGKCMSSTYVEWPPQCNSRVGGFTHTPPHQLANPPTPAVKYQEFCPPVSRPIPEGQDRSASLSSEVKPSCFRQNFGGGPGPFNFSSTASHRTHTPPHPQADPRPGNYIVMALPPRTPVRILAPRSAHSRS